MEKTLSIAILGKLWMPQVDASTTLNVMIGDDPFQAHFDDPTNLDDVMAYVDRNSGDFSQIIAVDVTYRESSTTLVSVQEAGDQTYTETRIIAREIRLATFSEEEEVRYMDTLDGGEEWEEEYA